MPRRLIIKPIEVETICATFCWRFFTTEVPCAWNCIQGKSKILRHPNKSWNSGGVSVEALRGDSSAQHHRTEVLRAVQTYIFSCGVAYFMDHIHLWHKYNPLGTTIFRSIDQRTQCHTRHSKNFCGRGEGYPNVSRSRSTICSHDDVIKWKHFPRYWPFVRRIHRSPVNSPHKGQWRGALMFSLIYAWTNGWVNNRSAGDLRHHCAHYDVIVMSTQRLAHRHLL